MSADTTPTCARCGSDRIIEDAKVEDRITADRRVSLEVMIGYRKAGSLLPEKPQRFPLTARICGACGFTEMYVADPEKLWKAAGKLTRKA
ncbi:MAG: putative nucleic-acid-binding Zn-ribbon protein [Myxococcota bacterium]|jgi:predicted nucleic-acid-binding Zn-ribbon protein